MSKSYSNPSGPRVSAQGWQTLAIEDVCEAVTSGGTPLRSRTEYYRDGTIPWFKTKELKDNILTDSEEKITERALEESSAKLFPIDTVLMAMYGDGKTITSLGILGTEAATNQACCAMIPDAARCDPRFLFYSLKHHRQDFIRIASGGAQRNLSGKLIRRFAIGVPGLQRQHRIAHILGTLDDKIELNRRMSGTLEAIARAIFKSWFVDFDPIHAKAEGREPVGMDPETAALFPDSFQDSPLGKIPKGWEIGHLAEHIEFALGGDWGKEAPDDVHTEPAYCIRGTDLPLLQAGQLPELRLRYLKPSSLKKRALQPFDLVFEVSGGSPTQSTGRSLLLPEQLLGAYDLPMVCTNFCRLVRFSSEEFALFAGYLLRHLYSSGEFFAHETGTTTIKNFAFKRFTETFNVSFPEQSIPIAFAEQVAPIQARRTVNGLESALLAESRDTLLPLLLNGTLLSVEPEELEGANDAS